MGGVAMHKNHGETALCLSSTQRTFYLNKIYTLIEKTYPLFNTTVVNLLELYTNTTDKQLLMQKNWNSDGEKRISDTITAYTVNADGTVIAGLHSLNPFIIKKEKNESGTLLQEFKHDSIECLSAIALSACGTYCITGGKALYIWECASGKQIKKIVPLQADSGDIIKITLTNKTITAFTQFNKTITCFL